MWNISNRKLIRRVPLPSEIMRLHMENNILACATKDGSAYLFNISSLINGGQVLILSDKLHEGQINGIQFDSHKLITATISGHVVVRDFQTPLYSNSMRESSDLGILISSLFLALLMRVR